MTENKKTYNGHTYSGNLLSACLNGYEQGRADAFKEFVDSYREFCMTPHDEETCLKSDEECDGMCIDCFAKWVQTKGTQITR